MSGSIEGATIKLNGMSLTHEFTQTDQLIAVIGHQYLMQLLRQLYKVIGSLELVGNPVRLVANVGTGVRDFFYEPWRGLIKGGQRHGHGHSHGRGQFGYGGMGHSGGGGGGFGPGPGAGAGGMSVGSSLGGVLSKRSGQTIGFTRGVAKGTISLVGNTTYGVFNAASRITTNLGHGVAVLSMDAEYLRHRQQHVLGAGGGVVGGGAGSGAGGIGGSDGVSGGGGTMAGGKLRKKQVVSDTLKRLGGDMDGIVGGLTGLVSKPLDGARADGVRGFARGLGAGVAGAITKPTAGMLDMVTHMSEGVRDLAAGLVLHKQTQPVTRLRPPHTFGPAPDGRLLTFNWARSQVC